MLYAKPAYTLIRLLHRESQPASADKPDESVRMHHFADLSASQDLTKMQP